VFWFGNQEIYAMNADGSDQARLTFSPAVDNHPSRSPDGSKIAFTSFRDGRYRMPNVDLISDSLPRHASAIRTPS
jgi:Tol biopolymer transport system component